MKLIKIKFLGQEYEIKCEDDEVSKIKNLEERLNNRVKNLSKLNNNFTNTHKLLLAALYLEDQVNDLLQNNKLLIKKIDENNSKIKNKEIIESLQNINKKIRIISNKISKENSE